MSAPGPTGWARSTRWTDFTSIDVAGHAAANRLGIVDVAGGIAQIRRLLAGVARLRRVHTVELAGGAVPLAGAQVTRARVGRVDGAHADVAGEELVLRRVLDRVG